MKGAFLKRFSGISLPVHGGREHSPDLLDFSISVNPFELPQSVKNAYHQSISSIGSYPDTGNTLLKQAVSETFKIAHNRLLMTNGSAEAFSLLAGVILEPGKDAYIMSPCYSDYEHVSRLNGAGIIVHRLDPAGGFVPDARAVVNEIRSLKPGLIWLCSPNNPTGVILDPGLIEEIASISSEYGGYVALDQAYSAFSTRETSPRGRYLKQDNIITLRSLTKDFGIPGLRLGYIEAAPELISIMDLYKPCWSVSIPAQKVGAALMDEIQYYRSCWERLQDVRKVLLGGMASCGINPQAASANECGVFIFFRAPDRPGAETFAAGMASHGIIIRDCESMGAPGFCRIGVRLPGDNEKFLEALRKVVYG